MDLYKAIQDLHAEKGKLDRVIASLEELQRTAGSAPVLPKPAKRRGRKSMNSSERQEVSGRMRKYWAGRRQPKQEAPSGAGGWDYSRARLRAAVPECCPLHLQKGQWRKAKAILPSSAPAKSTAESNVAERNGHESEQGSQATCQD